MSSPTQVRYRPRHTGNPVLDEAFRKAFDYIYSLDTQVANAVKAAATTQAVSTISGTGTAATTIGTPGPAGANGVGVPTGGAAGQVLAKNSGADYDTHWVTETGGSGSKIWTGSGDPNGGVTELTPTGMTGNSAPAPFVASASDEFTGSPFFGFAYKAFDGSLVDYGWVGHYTPGWLEIDLGTTGSPLASYSITAVFDSGVLAYCPYSWSLLGSNDGTTWTTIDTQTAVPGWSVNEVRSYTISPVLGYRYYRVSITGNQSGNGSYSMIAALHLYKTGAPLSSGADGDFYYDTVNRAFYGPLASGVWPLMGHLAP